MIKLFVFETVEDARAFNHEQSTHPAVRATPIIEDGEEKPYPEPEHRTLSRKPIRKSVKGAGYKKGVCGKCGKEGHSAWKCPDREPSKGEIKQREKDQRISETMERISRSPDELAEEIHRLQADGLTSIQIASRLKTTLMVVNRHWDPDIASNKGHDEEAEDSLL